MSVIGSNTGAAGAGPAGVTGAGAPDAAAVDALARELDQIQGKGAAFLGGLDGSKDLQRLVERLLGDERGVDVADLREIVKEAKDFRKITKGEKDVLTRLVQEHGGRMEPLAREALARMLGIPASRPDVTPARAPAPHDPVSEAANVDVNRAVDAFRDWSRYPYQVIVVPGFTPLDAKVAQPGVHPVAMERLQQAKKDFDSGKAPFVLLSGGAVYPAGTPYHEAIEMKKALIAMGVPADRVIVDAAARHSTTNLRNAGRYMLEHGLEKALVTTSFGQDFYFSYPDISTFHARSRKELGYEVGRLRDVGPFDGRHSEFRPSPDVWRAHLDDPLDP